MYDAFITSRMCIMYYISIIVKRLGCQYGDGGHPVLRHRTYGVSGGPGTADPPTSGATIDKYRS